MTITAKALQPGIFIGTGDTTLYTCPANTKAIVTDAVFVNTDTVARLFWLRVVRSGASPDTYLIKNRAIAVDASYVSPEAVNQTLNAGDYLVATADVAAKVSVVVNGFEIVA